MKLVLAAAAATAALVSGGSAPVTLAECYDVGSVYLCPQFVLPKCEVNVGACYGQCTVNVGYCGPEGDCFVNVGTCDHGDNDLVRL